MFTQTNVVSDSTRKLSASAATASTSQILKMTQELSEKLVDFIPKLLAIAERNLSPTLARKFDADDIVASVCRSVMRRNQAGRFEFFDNEELWKLVVVALKRKIYNKVRDQGAGKRDYRKETSFDQNEFLAAISREPDPTDVVEFVEILRQIESTVDDTARKVLEFKLAGMNNREIAAELGVTERTVGRKLVVLRSVIGEAIE